VTENIGSSIKNKKDLLIKLEFGQRIAEQESTHLSEYFVETEQWKSILRGEVDVVYGAKGAGKSAIYSLLLGQQKQLGERGISAIAAENPQGAPVFEDLRIDPPASEREFRALWKLYFACLLGRHLRELNISNDSSREVNRHLEEAELLPPEPNLRGILQSVVRYVRRIAQAESISVGEVNVDPVTGGLKGAVGKITLREPSVISRKLGFVTPDDLLAKADDALGSSGRKVWILLDRLDVVFAETPELEGNALKALFRVYLDCLGLKNVALKLFLRSDIWKRITIGGFREASHISRHTTIRWHRVTLANLIVRRLLHNQGIADQYHVDATDILSNSKKQFDLLARIFPVNLDSSSSHPLDWMMAKLHDGSGLVTPREVIHFLVQAREIQITRLEVGVVAPSGESLFYNLAFDLALKDVSVTRFDQTLCQEFPQWKSRMTSLRGEKYQLSLSDLARIWHESEERALTAAENLVEIGFFETPDSKREPIFSIPFLYRPVLSIKSI
jgi:hypothetical protein